MFVFFPSFFELQKKLPYKSILNCKDFLFFYSMAVSRLVCLLSRNKSQEECKPQRKISGTKHYRRLMGEMFTLTKQNQEEDSCKQSGSSGIVSSHILSQLHKISLFGFKSLTYLLISIHLIF